MSDTTTTDIVPAARFLEGLSVSRLLTDEQLAAARARAESADPMTLATQLVDQDLLTR